MANAEPGETSAGTAASLVTTGTGTGIWELDPGSSTIAFAVKHFWGLMTVRGAFSGVSGRATVASSGAMTAEITIVADSLNTKNVKRDEHLRSADFFDVGDHPACDLHGHGSDRRWR